MTYLFIMNPMAGRGEHRETYLHLRKTLLRRPEDRVIRMDTLRPGDAQRMAAEAARRFGRQGVVIGCGGDGTLHEIVNGLRGTEMAMAAIPFGTGNDFAKKIYGRDWNLDQIRTLFGGPLAIAPIDTVRINDRLFLNVMSFGFDTKVAETSKRLLLFRKFSYQAAVAICLFQDKHYRLQFELEGLPEGGTRKEIIDFCIAAVCNASFYGNGFCPGPKASLNDGLLDFCIAEPMHGVEIARLAPRYAAGNIEGIPKVHTFRATGGVIRSLDGSNLPINCDGEILRCSEARFAVRPLSQRLLLPECAAQKLGLNPEQVF